MNQMITPKTINFNELVKNSTTTLSLDLQTKLVQNLNQEFTEQEQQWYIANLFVYMHYHPTNDYPINLENVFKMIGFAHKKNAKRTLENNFTLDDDYKIRVLPKEQSSWGGSGGEEIMLNIDTFKNLCMMAKTDKGKEIRKYYVKLENVYNKLIQEEMEITQQQLIENQKELKDKQKELNRERALRNKMLNRKWFDADQGDCVYVFVDNVNDPNSLIKIGKSKHIMDRETAYSNANKSGSIEYVKRCNDCSLTEKVCHHILDKHRENKLQEFFKVPLELAIKTIDDVVAFLDRDGTNNAKTECTGQTRRAVFDDPINESHTKKEKSSNDIASFINECCDLEDNLFIPKENLKNAYRIWARSVDPTYKKQFVKYCESTFKTSTIYIENQRRQCYKGLNLKYLTDLLDINGTHDYQVFIRDKCVIDWNNRVSYCDFFEAYIKWQQATNATFVLDYDTKKKLQKYLDSTFFGGRVHISSSTGATHLFGVWGLGLKGDGVNGNEPVIGLKTRNRTTKRVSQVNVSTGDVIDTWESITEASKSIGLPISTLSSYIRFGSKRINVDNVEVKYIFS